MVAAHDDPRAGLHRPGQQPVHPAQVGAPGGEDFGRRFRAALVSQQVAQPQVGHQQVVVAQRPGQPLAQPREVFFRCRRGPGRGVGKPQTGPQRGHVRRIERQARRPESVGKAAQAVAAAPAREVSRRVGIDQRGAAPGGGQATRQPALTQEGLQRRPRHRPEVLAHQPHRVRAGQPAALAGARLRQARHAQGRVERGAGVHHRPQRRQVLLPHRAGRRVCGVPHAVQGQPENAVHPPQGTAWPGL